jgi:peptide/nickel transport system substrate-binding protein
MTSRRTRSLSVLGVIAILMTSIGAMFSTVSAQEERQTLILAQNAGDIASLDPHVASATQDRSVVDMVFNGLIRFKPGDASTFEPDLATAIPEPVTEADGTQSWTFTLRQDAMCHSGFDQAFDDAVASGATPSPIPAIADTQPYPLTADDVIFSLQKTANVETSGVSADYANYTFEKVDASTVKVIAKEPVGPAVFLPKFANYGGGYIICKKAYDILGADGFKTNPVGTGPFKFVSYTPQQSTVLAANDEYFRGAPKLGGVEVRYIADNTARELGLQSGELHVINGLPEAQFVDRINQTGDYTADVFGVGEAVWLNLDINNEYLKDPKVREAIILAVSRENHVALAGSPVAEPIYSVVPTGIVPGSLSAEEADAAGVNYAQDIERAKTLLAEAGYGDGFTLNLVTSEQAAYLTNYTVLQEELAQIGITVELQTVQHAAMHEQIRAGSNAITIYIAYRPSADTYLTSFFTTGGGNTNFSHFTLDAEIAAARGELDPDAQVAAWQAINVTIEQNFAGYGLMYTNQVYARANSVDYGHELVSVPQLYPGIDETTSISA